LINVNNDSFRAYFLKKYFSAQFLPHDECYVLTFGLSGVVPFISQT